MDWLAFKTPERLRMLSVLPVLIIAYLVLVRLKGQTSLRYINTGVLGRMIGSQRRWTRHLAVFASLCFLVALTPVQTQPFGAEKIPREWVTVIMVIGTSLSVQASDMDPNRLKAAKTATKQFVDALSDSYNVALALSNGSPAVVMPPSAGWGALIRTINVLGLKENTAIGDVLDQALEAASETLAPGDGSEPVPATIAVLSGGGNTSGTEPAGSVGHAQTAGMSVFTVARGTENGYVDLDGKRHNVAPDNEVPQSISATTGGGSVSADNTDSLKDAYKRIGSSVGMEEVRKPAIAQYTFGAPGFVVMATSGVVMMAARWPR